MLATVRKGVLRPAHVRAVVQSPLGLQLPTTPTQDARSAGRQSTLELREHESAVGVGRGAPRGVDPERESDGDGRGRGGSTPAWLRPRQAWGSEDRWEAVLELRWGWPGLAVPVRPLPVPDV